MPYIKLLTVLAGLALLTACGGSATPKTDDTGGDTTTDCETNAFHADCNADAPAIELRQTMCLADSTTDDSCGAIITSFCTENPHRTFAGVCTGDTYLPNRIADCIEGGKADSPNCMTITTDTTKNAALTACLENPFEEACESLDDFTTFALARTNRLTFCNNNANVDDDLCTGDNVGIICGIDLFTAICPDATYLSERITDCIKTENTGIAKCNTVSTDSTKNTAITACLTNPFATACESVTDFMSSFADARMNRESFCGMAGNNTNALCMGASLMGVCGSNPFNASCFADATYLPARVTDCITGGNAGETRCNSIFTTTATNTCLTNPFAEACKMDGAFTSYLTDAQTKRLSFCVDEPMNTALCPAIVRTCITTPFANECTADVFRLARFNTCEAGENHAKCVNTGDLPTYETKPNAITGSGFLTATETGLNTNTADFQFANASTRTITTPHFIGRRGGADSTNRDGFAYFATNVSGGSTLTIGYAGILPTTNLGAPLPSTTANAVWAGHFSLGAANNIAVNYYVDFGAGKFGFSNAGGNGFGNFAHANLSGTYTMNAVFGEHDDAEDFNAGQMGGTLSVLDTIITTRYDIIGLIGEEGVVGIFAVQNGGVGDAGGFTATNPDYTPPE